MKKLLFSIVLCSLTFGIYSQSKAYYLTPSGKHISVWCSGCSRHGTDSYTYKSPSQSSSLFSNQEAYKKKVETFCAPGVNEPKKCDKYCNLLTYNLGEHKYCKEKKYTSKVDTFCAPGANEPKKCSKYCERLKKNGGKNKYCQ